MTGIVGVMAQSTMVSGSWGETGHEGGHLSNNKAADWRSHLQLHSFCRGSSGLVACPRGTLGSRGAGRTGGRRGAGVKSSTDTGD